MGDTCKIFKKDRWRNSFFTNSSKGQKNHQLDTQLGNSTNLFLVKNAFDLMKNYVI